MYFSRAFERGRNNHVHLQTDMRAEVVTFRFDVAFGSLLVQELTGFDELRNDQGMIRSCTAKTITIMVSLYLSASCLSFWLLRLAK
jgi:hypothetical protein